MGERRVGRSCRKQNQNEVATIPVHLGRPTAKRSTCTRIDMLALHSNSQGKHPVIPSYRGLHMCMRIGIAASTLACFTERAYMPRPLPVPTPPSRVTIRAVIHQLSDRNRATRAGEVDAHRPGGEAS